MIAAEAESAPTTRWRDEPEEGEHEHRQQDRVQAGDDRRARDLRVAHDLGDGERREGAPGDDLGRHPGGIDRQEPVEQPGRSLLRGGSGHLVPFFADLSGPVPIAPIQRPGRETAHHPQGVKTRPTPGLAR